MKLGLRWVPWDKYRALRAERDRLDIQLDQMATLLISMARPAVTEQLPEWECPNCGAVTRGQDGEPR